MITKTLASGFPGCVYELSATLTSLLHRTCTVRQRVPFFPPWTGTSSQHQDHQQQQQQQQQKGNFSSVLLKSI